MRIKYLSSFLFVLTMALGMLVGRMLLPSPVMHATAQHTGPTKGSLPILPKPLPIRHSSALRQANAWSIIPTTTSLYESTTDARTMYAQGCHAAHGPAGLIILDWGQPVYLGYGHYGT